MSLIEIDESGNIFYPTRTCPECETYNLEISAEDENVFECNYCGSIWQRLRPIKKNGEITNIPKKLRKMLKNQKL